MKDVLLYGPIYQYSAKEFIQAINNAGSEDITVRVNSDGGEVRYCWGMISKFAEHKGKKLVKNDGEAWSMGAYFFCYASDSEALDTSIFGLHRAGYADWFEKDPSFFTEAVKAELNAQNNFLRKALEAKIDVAAFEKEKGVTLDQLFSLDGRPMVVLTAKEAKKYGLINRIVSITPKKKAELDEMRATAEAKFDRVPLAAKLEEDEAIHKTTIPMTIEKLKLEHPAVFAQVFNEGKAVGVAEEKDRVEACLVFVESDPKGVKAAIEAGKPLTQKQIIEFSMNHTKAEAIKALKGDSAEQVTTADPLKDDAKKTEAEKFLAEASKHSTFQPAKK